MYNICQNRCIYKSNINGISSTSVRAVKKTDATKRHVFKKKKTMHSSYHYFRARVVLCSIIFCIFIDDGVGKRNSVVGRLSLTTPWRFMIAVCRLSLPALLPLISDSARQLAAIFCDSCLHLISYSSAMTATLRLCQLWILRCLCVSCMFCNSALHSLHSLLV